MLSRSRSAQLLVASIFVLSACGDDATSTSTSGPGGSGGNGGASSVASSSSKSGAASTTNASSSASGSQGGAACSNTDPGEPNDSEATAYDLGQTGCSDSDPGMIYGVLDSPRAQDWFRYQGSDDASCFVNPGGSITVDTGAARVCVYFECLSGNVDIGSCPAGTIPDTSPANRPGCCGVQDFAIDLNCTGTIDDSAIVYMRVDDPTLSDTCTAYAVAWHY